jgi:hypothetical protein
VPGVRTWVLPVEAKGKGTVTLGTQIRLPPGEILSGLEDLHLPQ